MADIKELERQIFDAKLMEEACSKLIQASSSLRQYFDCQREQHILSQHVDSLSTQSESASSSAGSKDDDKKFHFRISAFRLPIIIADDFKKNQLQGIYAFVVIKCKTCVVGSELVEINSKTNVIIFSDMTMLNVSHSATLSAKLYFSQIENINDKKQFKLSEVDKEQQKFFEVASVSFEFSDLIKSDTNLFDFKLEIVPEFESIPITPTIDTNVKNLSNLSNKSSSGKRNEKTPDNSLQGIFGTKFQYWNRACFNFFVCPVSLDTDFKKFVVQISTDKASDSLACIAFDGAYLRISNTSNWYMYHPTISFEVNNVSLKIPDQAGNVIDIISNCGTVIRAHFVSQKSPSQFSSYFDNYVECLSKYGPKLFVLLREKNAEEIHNLLCQAEENILKTFDKPKIEKPVY